MIPWLSVVFNGLWILGLAVMLAGLGYHAWLARQHGRSLRYELAGPGFLKVAWLGLGLFGAGLAGTGNQEWEVLFWLLFALFCFFNVIRLFRAST